MMWRRRAAETPWSRRKLRFEAIECCMQVTEERRVLRVDLICIHSHDGDVVVFALDRPRLASFTSFRYLRAGMFRWRVVWPFLLGAMPLAFIGGAIHCRVRITGPSSV
jgi:hypothetical protein